MIGDNYYSFLWSSHTVPLIEPQSEKCLIVHHGNTSILNE